MNLGALRLYHPNYLESYHPKGITYNQYHPSNKTNDVEWYHPGKHWGHKHIRPVPGSSTCSCGNKNSGGCDWVYKFTQVSGKWKYELCGCAADSSGCLKKESDSYYSCCGAKNSNGCQFNHFYECCRKGTSSSGCSDRYTCCGQPNSSAGCKYEYTCCSQSSGARGCRSRWQCCSNESQHIGCQPRCNTCKRPWGTSPGCSRPYTI